MEKLRIAVEPDKKAQNGVEPCVVAGLTQVEVTAQTLARFAELAEMFEQGMNIHISGRGVEVVAPEETAKAVLSSRP